MFYKARMKIAIYCRTSTNKQDNGLESQKRYLLDYCNRKLGTTPIIFKDMDISGKKSSRPQLDRLMASIRKNEIQTVIVYSFSRFAKRDLRSVYTFCVFMNFLAKM